MRRCVKTGVMVLMMELLTGDPLRTMEAAKQLCAQTAEVDPEFLTRIVSDPDYKLWSKIAALYVLGFIPVDRTSEHQHVLRKTLENGAINVRVRTHAAEALGNLRDKGAAALLGERLLDATESRNVRKWCIYALGEVGTPAAITALKRFSETAPHGVLAQELKASGFAANQT